MAHVNVRVDENVKTQAENVLSELGMNMSTAINIYLAKIGREKRIPFELELDPFYSEENMAELKRRAAKADAGQLTAHELIEVD